MNNEIIDLIKQHNKKEKEVRKLNNLIEEKTVEFLESILGKYIVAATNNCFYSSFSDRWWIERHLKTKKINNYTKYVYLGYADYKVWERTDGEVEDGIFFGNKLYFVRGTYGDDDEYGMYLMSYHITKGSKTLIEDKAIFKLCYLNEDLTKTNETFLLFDTEADAKLFMEVVE